MDIPLGVEVLCADGAACGRSTAIVLNPVTDQVTYFVIQTEGLGKDEYLVPIEAITESTDTSIRLNWDRDDVAGAEPFIKTVFVGEDESAFLAAGMTSSSMMWPYYEADQEYLSAMLAAGYEHVEQIPPSELAVRRGAQVEAADGQVGTVDEFLIDKDTGHITHLVLRKGHLWGQRDVTISVSQIDRVDANVVHLKLSKEAVAQLPAVPVRRK
jgi:sporulation protein YlmC with PRC-barrel domain